MEIKVNLINLTLRKFTEFFQVPQLKIAGKLVKGFGHLNKQTDRQTDISTLLCRMIDIGTSCISHPRMILVLMIIGMESKHLIQNIDQKYNLLINPKVSRIFSNPCWGLKVQKSRKF